jgi:hypothetical protein
MRRLFLSFCSVVFVSATAQAAEKLSEKVKPQTGFIPDYSLLQKIDGPKGTQIYRYRKTGVAPESFNAVVIDPVVLNQANPDGHLTADVLNQTRAALDQHVREAVASRGLKVVTEGGADVLRISVAISGAELETEGFKPRNILPISAILKVASKATGMESKTPTLLVESKLVDTQSQDLVGAGMITIAGESFRSEADTVDGFQSLTKRVVQLATQIASGASIK